MRLPSGGIYSTDPNTVAAGYPRAPLGPTPEGYDWCVGYTEYGPIWTNYDPRTGSEARIHWTHVHHRIVVTRRIDA